jgi:hypothetical protein
VRLELECSKELREGILASMLVSLNGRDFMCGDLLQEFHNRLVEFMVERKGKDFDSSFLRKVTRNLHHFNRIKKDAREGIGLGKHSSHHTAPHLRVEYKTLLKLYAESELHKHRSGRVIGKPGDLTHQFTKGLMKLEGGKLRQWIANRVRAMKQPHDSVAQLAMSEETLEDENGGTDDSVVNTGVCQTMGMMEMVDGELQIDSFTIEEYWKPIIHAVEGEEDDNDENDY